MGTAEIFSIEGTRRENFYRKMETKKHTEGTSSSLKQIEIRRRDSNHGVKEGKKLKEGNRVYCKSEKQMKQTEAERQKEKVVWKSPK